MKKSKWSDEKGGKIILNGWTLSHKAIWTGISKLLCQLNDSSLLKSREKRQQVRGGGIGIASAVKTGVMRHDLGFVEWGHTRLILLLKSVLSTLELSLDEKIRRERRRVPTKRWKPLRSLAQTDGEEDERRAGSKRRDRHGGESKEKCVTGILFVTASFTKPVASHTDCVEIDQLGNSRERRKHCGLFHTS